MFRILAITATLFGLMSVAHADVWRLTDAQGRVQYSDRWVPGSVLIKTDKNHPSPANLGSSDEQKLAASNQSIAEQQAQQQGEQTVKQDVAKNKEQLCKEATENYEKSVRSRRLYKEGKDGTREYVSDAEADAYRLRMLNARKDSCGK
jgi:hypothetical protein